MVYVIWTKYRTGHNSNACFSCGCNFGSWSFNNPPPDNFLSKLFTCQFQFVAKPRSHLIFSIIIVLNEVQNEVEHLSWTKILNIPEQSHSNWHGLLKHRKYDLNMDLTIMCHTEILSNVIWYLLKKVALEVNEVVGFDNVGTALAAKHACEEGLHGWRALPRAYHGVGNLQVYILFQHTH